MEKEEDGGRQVGMRWKAGEGGEGRSANGEEKNRDEMCRIYGVGGGTDQ